MERHIEQNQTPPREEGIRHRRAQKLWRGKIGLKRTEKSFGAKKRGPQVYETNALSSKE